MRGRHRGRRRRPLAACIGWRAIPYFLGGGGGSPDGSTSSSRSVSGRHRQGDSAAPRCTSDVWTCSPAAAQLRPWPGSLRARARPQGMAAASPTLLTPEEAARIARCSIKTVRRAYAKGALTAYRRRGSRAVLLDNQDVLAWARGELLQPIGHTMPDLDSKPVRQTHRNSARREDGGPRNPKLGSQQRFDLSAEALLDRRSSKTESLL
jgi:excisionase family DNA binding protein